MENYHRYFEKHIIINKLAALRRFHTATVNENEKVLGFITHIRKLVGSLQSMGVIIKYSEMAMEILNGLPDRDD